LAQALSVQSGPALRDIRALPIRYIPHPMNLLKPLPSSTASQAFGFLVRQLTDSYTPHASIAGGLIDC
jgi:hypothetical protein